MLEAVDEHLLRSLVKAQSKTPLEFLYLEAGAVPIRFLLSSRRMVYLLTILKREDSELIKRIYKAQSGNPSHGDWSEMLKADFKTIGEVIYEQAIVKSSKNSYKNFIKAKVRTAALKHLNNLKGTHSKIQTIEYVELKTQSFITSPIFSNDDVSLLYSLRSRSVDCKANFKSIYKDTDILCPFCKKEDDSQQHMLECEVIKHHFKSTEISQYKIVYDDIFKDIKKQKGITSLFRQGQLVLSYTKWIFTGPVTKG